jgi:hypothetical protein
MFTTFILVIYPFKEFSKTQISNFRNSNIVFLYKMISNEKVINCKVI